MKKEVKQVLAQAVAQGMDVVKPGDCYKVKCADGTIKTKRNNGSRVRVTRPGYPGIVYVTPGPSDHRGVLNDIRWLRQELDFEWKGR